VANLVDNAIAHSDDAGIVRVTLSSDGETVVIDVTDQGSGIPADALERVFERFYRVDAARSRARGGTGIGLSIVKHVAQAHGGSVAVRSTLGVGSTFELRLPVSPDAGRGTLSGQ
jgi:two-component system sensor histidine kinase SenX3